jgi:hypothetical protein
MRPGATRPCWTARNELRCRFDVETVYGIAARASASDQPDGLALDLTVDRATGEQLAEYARDNGGAWACVARRVSHV